MTTPAKQRLNMVESQIRPSDVTDRRILRAMAEVERERFVPADVVALAYMDEAVPFGAPGRTLMPPRTFAKLVQLAEIEPGDSVLIVGSGRGYSAAVVAQLSATVIALEPNEGLAAAAKGALAAHANVTVVTGPLAGGPPGNALFDAILVEGAVPSRPEQLLARLKPGGRLVAVLARDGASAATRWTKTPSAIAEAGSFDAAAPVLPGFERVPAFVL